VEVACVKRRWPDQKTVDILEEALAVVRFRLTSDDIIF
jgi:hypothetical protein